MARTLHDAAPAAQICPTSISTHETDERRRVFLRVLGARLI
jgi:hypothetical protein